MYWTRDEVVILDFRLGRLLELASDGTIEEGLESDSEDCPQRAANW